MYNSKDMTVDKDLTFLSYNQTINKEFSVEDILTSDLWLTNDDNGLIKAVPLFNCDKITSNNQNDKVLDDNKCVILENINETLIQCISDDTGAIHYYTVELYAYASSTVLDVVDETNIYCIVYDEYMNTLNNVEIDVYVDNTFDSTVSTDSQGICRFKADKPCNIKFKYGTIESNIITTRASHNYQIVLTGDTIIKTGDTATITATLTDDGKTAKNKLLNYEIKHKNTVLSTGSAKTNNNGQININYNGTGIGEITVLARRINVEEPHALCDTIKYDTATTTDHNNIWTNGISTLTRASEYSIIKETDSTNIILGLSVPSSNIRIEFDVYQPDGATSDSFYQFMQNGEYLAAGKLEHINKPLNSWNHVVIELPYASGYHLLSDGVNSPVQRSMDWDTSSNVNFNLWTSGDVTELRFKNFKVYTSTIAKDDATISKHTDIWVAGTSTLTRASEYSIIKETSLSNVILGINIPSSSIRIEFDVYQVDGDVTNAFYQFQQNGIALSSGNLGQLDKSLNSWNHVVIELPPDEGYYFLSDDVNTAIRKSMDWDTSSNIRFNFWTARETTELRFKNFIIYFAEEE